MCLGNTSKDFTGDNIKRTGYIDRIVFQLIMNINIDNILDIYKYLMKKHNVQIYQASAYALSSFGGSLATKFVLLNNQPWQVRLTLIDSNSNKPLYYPFVITVVKCGRNCNTTDDPYVRICVPNRS